MTEQTPMPEDIKQVLRDKLEEAIEKNQYIVVLTEDKDRGTIMMAANNDDKFFLMNCAMGLMKSLNTADANEDTEH